MEREYRPQPLEEPFVTQQEAVAIQQTLWEEARAFLEKTVPYYTPDMIGSRTIYRGVQYFPEEHPIEETRQMAFGAVCRVQDVFCKLKLCQGA